MGDHYFSADPRAPSRVRQWSTRLRGRSFTFLTDSGMFSPDRVDPGTRLLVESVPLPEEGEVLDLGCGYGVLGIVVAASAPGVKVTMVDVNRRALELARRNAVLNGVPGVSVVESDGFGALQGRRFHLILTNPPIRQGKDLVGRWLREAKEHLYPGGRLALVVRTRQGALTWKRRLEEWYGSCEELAKGGGYRVYQVVHDPGGERPDAGEGVADPPEG